MACTASASTFTSRRPHSVARARHRVALVLLLFHRHRHRLHLGRRPNTTLAADRSHAHRSAAKWRRRATGRRCLPVERQAAGLAAEARPQPKPPWCCIPSGTLQVSQRRIPLDLVLDKVGNQAPSDANDFTLNVIRRRPRQDARPSGAVPAVAVPQLRRCDQALAAGFRSAGQRHRTGRQQHSGFGHCHHAPCALRPDGHGRRVRTGAQQILRPFARSLFTSFLAGNAAAQSKLSAAYRTQDAAAMRRRNGSPRRFTVAFQSSNQAFHAEATAFTSQASAQDYVAKTVAANPSLAGQLHVLPQLRGGCMSPSPDPLPIPRICSERIRSCPG